MPKQRGPEVLRVDLFGELALDGSIRPIKGALSMAMTAAEKGITKLLVPSANAREAAVVEKLEVYAAVSAVPGTTNESRRSISDRDPQ